MDEAVHFGHHEVATTLQQYQEQYTPPAGPAASADSQQGTEKSPDSPL